MQRRATARRVYRLAGSSKWCAPISPVKASWFFREPRPINGPDALPITNHRDEAKSSSPPASPTLRSRGAIRQGAVLPHSNTPSLRAADSRTTTRTRRLVRRCGVSLRPQKIQQQLFALGGHDRLGVKLNPLNRVTAMAQAHDLSLGGFCGDL